MSSASGRPSRPVVNMIRQVGMAIGVAVPVAVIGKPDTSVGHPIAFKHGRWAIAAMALAGAATAPLPRRRMSPPVTARSPDQPAP